ncbi:hypothetical protein NDU88_003429 [Pleurodeles waltl]|uniref:Uncharacterized protein n=1 Tax=Pleurodeles waltl TaxID=8319 RepID=A0AAV7UYG3_PLEWA|nr:hypothetical protein NDU88_003429 [Pleurodeles waltl]
MPATHRLSYAATLGVRARTVIITRLCLPPREPVVAVTWGREGRGSANPEEAAARARISPVPPPGRSPFTRQSGRDPARDRGMHSPQNHHIQSIHFENVQGWSNELVNIGCLRIPTF